MTEQERVQAAANMLAAFKWVIASPARERKWQDSLTHVTSGEIADLLGLEVEVVEAAVRNLGEEVTV